MCSTVHGFRGPEAFPSSAAHPRGTMHDGITVLSVALCQANYALSILRRSLLLLETETLKKAVRGRGGIIIERFLDIVSVFFFFNFI